MLTERLARYTHSLRYDDLPGEVVHEVKRRLIDSLGCALGAWSAKPYRIAREQAQSIRVPGGATIWGTGHKTSPDLAAFANGTGVRYLDFNDTYLSKEPAHPSDNMSAVLAVGETSGASGKRVIQALVVAYEVQCRLCDAAALRPRGWDHVTYGPVSSTLGAAKVLNFSVSQTAHAAALAGVANVALRQTRVGEVSMWKACAFANAARNGVFAALLAQRGMTGPSPLFEGEKGFMKLVSGSFDLSPLGGEKMNGTKPAPFKILDTYIKHFPVEYHAQTAVEAALALRKDVMETEGAGVLTTVSDIEIGSYDVAIEIIGRDPEKWQPSTRETADHSFPYCVAVALLDGRVTLQSFSEKRLRDPALLDLMKKTRVVRAPEFVDRYPDAMPTSITITTKTGRSYKKQVDIPLGHPLHRMSDREVEEKFRDLARGRLDRTRMAKLLDAIWALDRAEDVGKTVGLLKVA
jgi:2-methylcitrate dehydratase